MVPFFKYTFNFKKNENEGLLFYISCTLNLIHKIEQLTCQLFEPDKGLSNKPNGLFRGP